MIKFHKQIKFLMILAIALGGSVLSAQKIKVGLITKTETNPFFVKMKEGAEAEAKKLGAELMTAAGSYDGDNASQITAIENMVNAGVKGILLTPSDTKAIVPSVQRARRQGVIVIALDTPTDPQDATDALFATDNYQAGVLIGQYARAVFGNKRAVIATLDLAAGLTITVDKLRHNGFLDGFGVTSRDEIACMEVTAGNQSKGQTAMENCISKNKKINLVYTINEPAAFGAHNALKKAGMDKDVTIVSIDGGCAGVRGVKDGSILATSQQYPLRMASLGVNAVVHYAKTGVKPSGYTDTGVTLITDEPARGIVSGDTVYGLNNCWGE